MFYHTISFVAINIFSCFSAIFRKLPYSFEVINVKRRENTRIRRRWFSFPSCPSNLEDFRTNLVVTFYKLTWANYNRLETNTLKHRCIYSTVHAGSDASASQSNLSDAVVWSLSRLRPCHSMRSKRRAKELFSNTSRQDLGSAKHQ